LVDLKDGRLTVDAAAALMEVGRRQVYRLLAAFDAKGPAALVSKQRGRASNRAHGETFRRTVLGLVRERYRDFGPTLAAEKLRELHGLPLGVETLRQWMIEAGIWLRRRDRKKQVFQPRPVRDCVGELVQIDGCEHWWFEDRGPQCTLLVFVDDATSQLMHLKFVPSESAFAYFQATREYLERYGKPIAFYSDKHSVFRVSKTHAVGGDGMTQFGRALNDLNIDILCANSPQAKGRVERAHKTLQDRLVKELRLAAICDIEAANAFLSGFRDDYNARFGKPARFDKDLHRPLLPDDDLDGSFAWQEERTVTLNLAVQYDRVMFILEPNEVTRGLVRKKVTIYDYPDGRIEVRYNGLSLPYRTFDRVARVVQGAIVENKRLTEALDLCREIQAHIPPKPRSRSAPRRSDQANHMFAPAAAAKSVALLPAREASGQPPIAAGPAVSIGAGGRLNAAMLVAQQMAAKLPAQKQRSPARKRGFLDAAES
jgi:transposase